LCCPQCLQHKYFSSDPPPTPPEYLPGVDRAALKEEMRKAHDKPPSVANGVHVTSLPYWRFAPFVSDASARSASQPKAASDLFILFTLQVAAKTSAQRPKKVCKPSESKSVSKVFL
jgi:hypothetical protein